MFAFEPFVIIKPFDELLGKADDVPIVGYLFGPQLIQTHRSSSQLVDAHAGGDRGQVDQDIDARSIPTLAEKTPGADKATGQTFLEKFRHHG